MYEQYTDKQIVEMLKPKLTKILGDGMWDTALEHSEGGRNLIELITTIYRSAYIRGQLGRSFIIGEKQANKKKDKDPANTFKVGDKVKFLGLNIEDEEALTNRRFFPPVNTIGEIVEFGSNYCIVQWPRSTTSGDGVWDCRNSYLEKVTEHWVPVNGNNIQKGDSVRYIGKYGHKNNPEYYPAKDVVGKVIKVYSNRTCFIQWPKGATSQNGRWRAAWGNLEVLLCE